MGNVCVPEKSFVLKNKVKINVSHLIHTLSDEAEFVVTRLEKASRKLAHVRYVLVIH